MCRCVYSMCICQLQCVYVNSMHTRTYYLQYVLANGPHKSMYLWQYTADLAALDHLEAVRRLEKTNFRPRGKSDIEFMKKKFKKRWESATQKLTITRQSESKTSDPSSDIATKEKTDDKTTSPWFLTEIYCRKLKLIVYNNLIHTTCILDHHDILCYISYLSWH